MFKRSLASCVAAATLATAIAIPANAYELTIEGDVCTVQLSAEESALFAVANPGSPLAPGPTKTTRQGAKIYLQGSGAIITETRDYIEMLEEESMKPGQTLEQDAYWQTMLKENKAKLEILLIQERFNTDCANGKSHSQKEDDAKAALSSEDGKPNDAGIGLIVGGVILGVVGLIAAALPALAPMLPAQIRAMLHI